MSRPTPTPRSAPTAQPTPAPIPVRDLAAIGSGPLGPGRYTRSTFAPRVVFTIGSGWSATVAISGMFDVERSPGTPDAVAVQFARPSDLHSANAAVTDLLQRDDLVVTNPVDVTVGGHPGLQMEIQSTNPDLAAGELTRVFSVAAGAVNIGSGRHLEVTFIDTADGLLAVMLAGSQRQWAAAQDAGDPVVASVTLGGS